MTTFSDVVRELGRGSIQAELTETLANLVQAVRDTGKSGEMTLKLKLKPLNQEALETEVAITTKHPQPKRSATVFFHTEQGELLRHHPGQEVFPELLEDDEASEAEEKTA